MKDYTFDDSHIPSLNLPAPPPLPPKKRRKRVYYMYCCNVLLYNFV